MSPTSYAAAVVATASVIGALQRLDPAGGAAGEVVARASVTVLAGVVVTFRRRLAAVPLALLHAIEDMPRTIRTGLAGLAVTADILLVVVVAAVGACDVAGGRCPDPSPEPLLDRDGLWLAGGWTLAAGVVVLLLTKRRGDPVAWLAVGGAAVVAGLIGA